MTIEPGGDGSEPAPADASGTVTSAAEAVGGVAHPPAGIPRGVVLLTHGAGGNRDTALLIRLCQEWADHGYLAVRYDLPFRRRRPKGPPSHSAPSDRAGIAEAIAWARERTDGPVIAGGHSYGGRMTSLLAAEHPGILDLLALSSYPLHPPGRPDRARTDHLPAITVPTVFTHGTRDPFGSVDELTAAADLVGAETTLVAIDGARHDLRSATVDVARLAVTGALTLLGAHRTP